MAAVRPFRVVRLWSQTRKGRWGGATEVQTFRPNSELILDTDLVVGKKGQKLRSWVTAVGMIGGGVLGELGRDLGLEMRVA